MTEPLRPDLEIIVEWIAADSRVLDLGCGNGELLRWLAREKKVSGYGLEQDDACIAQCIRNGVNVIQTDLDEGLSQFDDNSFDHVVLSLTLQAIHRPARLLEEMLRVGREGIVTFPNFGHWRARWQLLRGRMPMTRTLPIEWYTTPNIHLCTLRDFEALCEQRHIHIREHRAVDHEHRASLGLRLFPNLLGEIALYRFTRA